MGGARSACLVLSQALKLLVMHVGMDVTDAFVDHAPSNSVQCMPCMQSCRLLGLMQHLQQVQVLVLCVAADSRRAGAAAACKALLLSCP